MLANQLELIKMFVFPSMYCLDHADTSPGPARLNPLPLRWTCSIPQQSVSPDATIILRGLTDIGVHDPLRGLQQSHGTEEV